MYLLSGQYKYYRFLKSDDKEGMINDLENIKIDFFCRMKDIISKLDKVRDAQFLVKYRL